MVKHIMLLSLVFAGWGCGAKREDPPPVQDDKKLPAQADKKPPPQGFARKLRRPLAQNELKQIALLYSAYVLDANRAPKDLATFIKANKRDAGPMMQALEDGWYVMNLKARQGPSDIVVYEAEADESGNVFAARLDGTVHTLTMDQVKAELPR